MFMPFCGLFFSPCYETYPIVVPSRQPGHARWRDRAAARPTTHGGAAKRRAWRPGGARSVDRGRPRAGDPTRGPGGGPRLAAAANTASGCLGPGASHHCSPTTTARPTAPAPARLGSVWLGGGPSDPLPYARRW